MLLGKGLGRVARSFPPFRCSRLLEVRGLDQKRRLKSPGQAHR
jgi:hypothetical protein